MNVISVVSSRIDLNIDEIRRKTDAALEKNIAIEAAALEEISENIVKKIKEAASIGLREVVVEVFSKDAFSIKEIFSSKGFEVCMVESLTIKTPSGKRYPKIKIAW